MALQIAPFGRKEGIGHPVGLQLAKFTSAIDIPAPPMPAQSSKLDAPATSFHAVQFAGLQSGIVIELPAATKYQRSLLISQVLGS